MKTLRLYCLILISLLFAVPALAKAKKIERTVSAEQREQRLQHSQELLGKHYSRSAARVGKKIPKINKLVFRWTKDRLPKQYSSKSKKIAQAIIDESFKHKFDPIFLMSVIQGESSFRPAMIGAVGEIGLMQIRPETGKWIAQKYKIKWKGEESLYDPVTNIRIGAAFLSYLREHFDMHAQLYLAAYNMGQGNVKDALSRKVWPKDYPQHVMKYYIEFYEMAAEEPKTKRSLANDPART